MSPTTPPTGPNLEKQVQDLLDVTKGPVHIEDNQAVLAMQQGLAASAGKDQEDAKSILINSIKTAAKLEFDHEVAEYSAAHPDKTPQEVQQIALQRVQHDFNGLPITFAVNPDSGALEAAEVLPREEATTLGEHLQHEMQDALAIISDENASLPEKLAAAIQGFKAAQEYIGAALGLKLGDAYVGPIAAENTKQREAAAKKNKIRQEIREEARKPGGNDFDQQKAQTEKDIEETETDIGTKEGEVADAKTKVEDLETQLLDEEDEGKQKIIKDKITAAKENLAEKEKELADLTTKKKDLETRLKEIENLKEEQSEVPEKLKEVLKTIQTILRKLPEGKAPGADALAAKLSAATITPVGMDFKMVDGDGVNIDTSIPTFLDGIDIKVTAEEMGMKDGIVVNPDMFASFATGGLQQKVEAKSAEFLATAKDEITNAIDGYTKEDGTVVDAYEGLNSEELKKCLTSDSWVETGVGAVDGAVMYLNGEIVFQPEDGTAAMRFDITQEPAEFVALNTPPQYCTGLRMEDIPEGGDPDLLDKLYDWQQLAGNNEWKAKNFRELHAENRWTMHDGPDLTALLNDALKVENEGKWVEGTKASGTRVHMYFDGKTLYLQNVEAPSSVSVFQPEEQIRTGGTAPLSIKKDDAYFNGSEVVEFTDDMKDDGKRARGYTFEHPVWREKTHEEVAKAIPFSDDDFEAATEKAVAAKGWGSEGDKDAYFDGTNFYNQTKDGESLHQFNFAKNQENGNIAAAWEPLTGKYLNGSGDIVDRPNPDSFEYDRPTKTWTLDETKAIRNMNISGDTVTAGLIRDRLEMVLDFTEWKDNPSYSGNEVVRVDNVIYEQKINNPEDVWVADLEKGTYTRKSGWYLEGPDKKLAEVPSVADRVDYDTDTNTWNKLTPEESENRTKNRIARGVKTMTDSGREYQKNGDEWAVSLTDDGDKMLLRFPESNNTWQYKPEGDMSWTPVTDGLTQEAKDHWDEWYGSDDTQANKDALFIINGLREANKIEDIT